MALMSIAVLASCGAENTMQNSIEEQVSAGGTLDMVAVDITTDETTEPGDEVVLAVKVMQGTEAVEDADEVMFEVWQSGYRDQGEMIEGFHTENGMYEASSIFAEEGLYFIQAHTSARGLHVMPQQEIKVGNPDPESIVPDESGTGNTMEDMESHSAH